jgi:hypothetical protein
VRNLQIGTSRLDLSFCRHGSSTAVNLLNRDGNAEVEVVL